jgi:hypothetical protein
MREAVTDAQQRPGFPLRSLRSLQDGNENVCVGVEFNFAAHALTLELRVALNAAAVVSSTT